MYLGQIPQLDDLTASMHVSVPLESLQGLKYIYNNVLGKTLQRHRRDWKNRGRFAL